MIARVIVLERLGRLPGFLEDWRASGPALPLDILYADPYPSSAGEGCYQSHVQALDCDGPILIMEDDCYFEQRVDITALSYPDCDILYLGGQHFMAPTAVPGYPGIVRCNGDTNRTHAYIAFHPRALRQKMITDRRHLYPDLAIADYDDLVRYGLSPWVAGQRAGWSSIKEIELPDRMWQWQSVAP